MMSRAIDAEWSGDSIRVLAAGNSPIAAMFWTGLRQFGGRLTVRFACIVFGALVAAHLPPACLSGALAQSENERPSPRESADLPAATKLAPNMGSGLRGRVLDSVTGKPAAGVPVIIQATKQSLSGRADERAPRETRTDANGEYVFSGLPLLDYNLWAIQENRTCVALNSIPVIEGQVSPVDELQLVEGSWLEGRVLTLGGEPLSRDPRTGERVQIGLSGPSRPRTGTSIESCAVDDDGRFRLRVPAGRNFPHVLAAEFWQQVWRKEKFERGIDVAAGETLTVNFRISEKPSQRPPPPLRPLRDPVKLPPPVAAEWDAAETIRDLGGWYELDQDRHVVEINMVYDAKTGRRFENKYTDSDEALRIAPAFPRLKRLFLHKGQATDESLECLRDLKGLETFYIWDAIAITDAGAPHLSNLENLERIHLSKSPVGDAVLEAVAKLPKLQKISMQQNAFTDAGLAHLSHMQELRSLWIGMSKGKITDAGLAHLAGLVNLAELDLQQSQVTDAGLEHLKKLTNLQNLYLSSSPVTNKGRESLREALPNLNIR